MRQISDQIRVAKKPALARTRVLIGGATKFFLSFTRTRRKSVGQVEKGETEPQADATKDMSYNC